MSDDTPPFAHKATPFWDARTCLQAWFEALGPMNGASSNHLSGIYPVEDRLSILRDLHQRTCATREKGVRVPFMEAFEVLDLDLLDRLLLLALLRDVFDARSPGGLTLTRLCDAAGASAFFQQEMVRLRLEDSSTLRDRGLVENDGDGVLAVRYYRLAPWARQPILDGAADFETCRQAGPAPWPKPVYVDGKRAEEEDDARPEPMERVAPRLRLKDVVLSDEARSQIEDALAVPATARTLKEEWGMGEGLSAAPGAALLFFGPPGTGKTLAAEAIAGELGKPLWRLRVDQVLSRYVGGTEKRIAAAFEAARSNGGVVLLDEADSLLGSRDAAERRWEVTQSNVLLQEIERFSGVVILTTNRDEALDAALERRLLARVAFGMPDEAERAAIWKRHIPPRAPLASDVDLSRLAGKFPLNGAFIRTAALLASVKASQRPIGARLLTQADLEGAAATQLARQRDARRPVGFLSRGKTRTKETMG